MGFLKKFIKQNKVETSKTYHYVKDGINLDFTLTTKKQKQVFLELLEVAILEVDNEINK